MEIDGTGFVFFQNGFKSTGVIVMAVAENDRVEGGERDAEFGGVVDEAESLPGVEEEGAILAANVPAEAVLADQSANGDGVFAHQSQFAHVPTIRRDVAWTSKRK